MEFIHPVEEGRFLKRYKRFFADVELNGETVVAHVPNTGSMKGCIYPESQCLMTFNDDPKRKLKYTLQMIKAPTSWVGVNTHLSNQLVWELWETKGLKHWGKFVGAQKEVKINDHTRVDLVLWQAEALNDKKKISLKDFNDHKFHFVEVKNVTLADGKTAKFPDAVTTRGQKHLQELMDLIEDGHSAELLLTVQRTDCTEFTPADDIDPEYGKLFREAIKKGLKVTVVTANFSKTGISLDPSNQLRVKI